MKNIRLTSTSLRSEDFDYRLDGYSKLGAAALATVATVVGTTAEAQIQNITQFKVGSGAFTTTAPHVSTHFHLNSYLGFKAGNATGQVLWSRGSLLVTNHGSQNAGKFYARYVAHGGSSMALNLHTGARVSAQAIGALGKYLVKNSGGGLNGNFVPTGGKSSITGYVGFRTRFNAHNQNYYGWLRVKVTTDGGGVVKSVTFVADTHGVYGAVGRPADHITVGETATAIPEPATVASGLALFALGAVGVREFRRRKAAA